MDGLFEDVIVANRDLVRTFTYLETLANGTEGDPIPLTDYVRLLYKIQTDEANPIDILLIDTDEPDQSDWLYIATPATDGVINLAVPGSELPWQHSDSGHWYHEMALVDSNGGILPFFNGRVLYKKPAILVT